jgi:hypothetical protein
MSQLEWSNGRGARGRMPWLLFVKSGKVIRFTGESIPGVVAVVGSDYVQNGKWSHTTYRLELAPGVRAIPGRDGWETETFREGLRAATGQPTDRWYQCANALGVTLAEAQRFLREWRPLAAEHYDQVEAALEAVATETDDDFEEIAVSFGSPTRRQREAGFWTWPVIVARAGQEIGRLTLDSEGYKYEVASGPIRILEQSRSGGYGGGYVSIRIAAPAGSRAIHAEPQLAAQM